MDMKMYSFYEEMEEDQTLHIVVLANNVNEAYDRMLEEVKRVAEENDDEDLFDRIKGIIFKSEIKEDKRGISAVIPLH